MNAASIAHALSGRKRASGWTARCPAHDDRDPSLSISISKDGKTLVHCHAGCSQGDVIAALAGLGLWNSDENQIQARVRIISEEFHDYEAKRRALALEIWNSTMPANGTLTETYLAGRAITLPMSDRLRFHNALAHTPTGCSAPAMVALVTGVDDKPMAVHRTYLCCDGSGKADVDPPRMTLGGCRRGGVRLGQIRRDEWLAIAEGIETTLSVMQACGLSGLAALSADGLRNLMLPREANLILLCADHDENGVGQSAVHAARNRFRAEGRRVRIIVPPDSGSDFNDLLMQQVNSDGALDVG
jgi:putative DNA primase/helicase